MKQRLKNIHDITLQHDSLEREAREIILNQFPDRTMPGGAYQLDTLTKLVKAAFFAGQQSLLDDINEDGPEDAPKLTLCRCGNATCTTIQFSNYGRFYQGAGFSLSEALLIRNTWKRAEDKPEIGITLDIESYRPDNFGFDTPWVATYASDEGITVVGEGRGEMSAAEFRKLYTQEWPAGDPWTEDEMKQHNIRNKVRNEMSKRYPGEDPVVIPGNATKWQPGDAG